MDEMCRYCGRSAMEHRALNTEPNVWHHPESHEVLDGRTVSLRNCPGFSEADSERIANLNQREREGGRKRGLKSGVEYYDL